jgi:hypothetical protein
MRDRRKVCRSLRRTAPDSASLGPILGCARPPFGGHFFVQDLIVAFASLHPKIFFRGLNHLQIPL